MRVWATWLDRQLGDLNMGCEASFSPNPRDSVLRASVYDHPVVILSCPVENEGAVLIATLTSAIDPALPARSYVNLDLLTPMPRGVITLGPDAMLDLPQGRRGGVVFLSEIYTVPWWVL